MSRELWIDGWSFLKTKPLTTYQEMESRKAEFQPVELPHDWLIYDTKNLYEDSFGWYRKTFTETLKCGERLQVCFDGVYMDSTVYVNGEKVMDWKYGYTAFTADVTDFLVAGENEIVVLARHLSPNSRWYSGAGIYRNVWLRHCPDAYLPVDGTYVCIRPVDDRGQDLGDFTLEVTTELAGNLSGVRVEYTLRREEGETVFVKEGSVDTGAALKTKVTAPALWSMENPVCYCLETRVYRGEMLLDEEQTTVGFRHITFDPNRGLFLNGKNVKLHGVCEHHDFGCLGAQFSEAALLRKFRMLKDMGVNAIRSTHNPPAREFMELADRKGFLIVSEGFDMWERSKTTYDYARFFIDWAQRDVASWVRRDRNHPSLLMWSIGNEIYDTHADEHGQEITARLIAYVRENDPKENAAITIGSNFMPWENAQKCADMVKFAGYNYGEKYYRRHHEEHPDWIIYGSETASVVQSRGIYHFPLSQSILADEDLQCSALGNSSTSWGAVSTEQCIIDDRDAEFAFGQFIWTGFDYIGEPTPYHTKNSYFGQLDTAGFPKDPYYTFMAEWTDGTQKPMVHLFPYWDFNPGQLVDVRAASNAASVELRVNGLSRGRIQLDHAHGRSLLANWQVAYEPGVITAIAYDEEGREVARDERKSFGDSRQLCLRADKHVMKADTKDLIFLTIEALDAQGHPVDNGADYVTVTVEGPARLVGMDNGDSTDYDPYKTNTRKLFSGKLLAVIKATDRAGDICVTASGEGLLPAQILLESEEAECLKKDYLEDCGGGREHVDALVRVPVRKIELSVEGDRDFDRDNRVKKIRATIYPENAQAELIWKVVNDGGIEIPYATVEVLGREENVVEAQITAKGDGAFRLRCMAREPGDRITVLSQLEFEAKGLGSCLLDPYSIVMGGLFTQRIGEIGNGNEKGISTARDGVSAVVFADIDFGEFGSDEITLPVFAMSGEEHLIELWEGAPDREGSRLIQILRYQKPSVWNVYQEETWILPERLKGVKTLAFCTRNQKIHLKGFSFRKLEKAFERLTAGEATRVYGDEFRREGHRVEGIGNNVTLEFENMDFGESGSGRMEIVGWTPLAVNTIHVRFNPEGGQVQARTAEFQGTGREEYQLQSFSFERFTGKGRLDLIFLPGCQFNLESIRFRKDEE